MTLPELVRNRQTAVDRPLSRARAQRRRPLLRPSSGDSELIRSARECHAANACDRNIRRAYVPYTGKPFDDFETATMAAELDAQPRSAASAFSGAVTCQTGSCVCQSSSAAI